MRNTKYLLRTSNSRKMNDKLILKTGVFFSGITIVIGAFGAHYLKDILGESMDVFKTGIWYQMFHSIALLFLALFSKIYQQNCNIVFFLFVFGIVLFSGSLYVISIFKYSLIGVLTPIGGSLFIIAWLLLLMKIQKI